MLVLQNWIFRAWCSCVLASDCVMGPFPFHGSNDLHGVQRFLLVFTQYFIGSNVISYKFKFLKFIFLSFEKLLPLNFLYIVLEFFRLLFMLLFKIKKCIHYHYPQKKMHLLSLYLYIYIYIKSSIHSLSFLNLHT